MLREKHQLFVTDVYKLRNPSAKSDNKNWLEAKRILDLKKGDAGRLVSNLLGWHSSIPLQREPAASNGREIHRRVPSGSGLAGEVDRACSIQDRSWANVNNYGAHNRVHNHGGSHLSGCYYIAVPPKSGEIELRDPREVVHMMLLPHVEGNRALQFRIAPQLGDLLVFPAWLLHGVVPNMTHEERVSVTFNARVVGGV
jgi:uncharacterized protein (TIGR02466 family)